MDQVNFNGEEDVEDIQDRLAVAQNTISLIFKLVVKFLSLKEKAKCQLVCHQ